MASVLPSRALLVLVRDPSRFDFVLSAAIGDGATSLLASRVGVADPMVSSLRFSTPTKVRSSTCSFRSGEKVAERHASFGEGAVVHGLPVFALDRLVAILEIVDPEVPLDKERSMALQELTRRFGAFVASRPFLAPVSR